MPNQPCLFWRYDHMIYHAITPARRVLFDGNEFDIKVADVIAKLTAGEGAAKQEQARITFFHVLRTGSHLPSYLCHYHDMEREISNLINSGSLQLRIEHRYRDLWISRTVEDLLSVVAFNTGALDANARPLVGTASGLVLRLRSIKSATGIQRLLRRKSVVRREEHLLIDDVTEIYGTPTSIRMTLRGGEVTFDGKDLKIWENH